MGKLAQYRLLKKVKKMLDAPAKNEEVWDGSSSSIYIGDKSARSEKYESNPNHNLRRTQVNEMSLMLLQQISRIENLLQGGRDPVHGDDGSLAIDEAFIDIVVAFLEFDRAMLFTEAEKLAQRQHASNVRAKQDLELDSTSGDRDMLVSARVQIEEWQRDLTQRQRKLSRIETTVRDLGLNVNDIRCAQILGERKRASTALEALVSEGARLSRNVDQNLRYIYTVAKMGGSRERC